MSEGLLTRAKNDSKTTVLSKPIPRLLSGGEGFYRFLEHAQWASGKACSRMYCLAINSELQGQGLRSLRSSRASHRQSVFPWSWSWAWGQVRDRVFLPWQRSVTSTAETRLMFRKLTLWSRRKRRFAGIREFRKGLIHSRTSALFKHDYDRLCHGVTCRHSA